VREVERPVKRPMHCAAIPYVGQSNRNVRWVDTGSELPGSFDNHVYLSDAAVREAMQTLKYPLPGEFREVKADRDRLSTELEAARRELAELRGQMAAVQVLKQAGYEQARKPGRPPKVSA
jgi:ribosomal protein L29